MCREQESERMAFSFLIFFVSLSLFFYYYSFIMRIIITLSYI